MWTGIVGSKSCLGTTVLYLPKGCDRPVCHSKKNHLHSWHLNNITPHVYSWRNTLLVYRADSRLMPSQWETSLQSNGASHWLGNPKISRGVSCCIITATSYGRLGISDHRKFDLLFNSLFQVNKTPHHWPLWEETNSDSVHAWPERLMKV